MKVRNLINLLLLGMVTASLTESCVSDLIHDYWEGSYEEGKETTISLKVNIPEMNVATRSDIGDDVASKVTSLWVGIFSAKTGKCTYAKLYTGQEETTLTADMFHDWNGYGADAQIRGNADGIGSSGNVVLGPTSGNVYGNIYADCTGYTKMRVTATGASGLRLRVLLNRQAMGDSQNPSDLQERSIYIGNDGTGELDLTEFEYVHVNSIKIGEGSGTVTSIQLLKEGDAQLPSGHHNFTELTIPTVSGLSYIVAVANPESNSGYLYNSSSDGAIAAKPLTELLPQSASETFTWDDYKNIAISRRSLTNIIDDPMGNLIMSGIYYDDREDPTPAGWETLNQYENPTYIPASSFTGSNVIEMPGAIHLRRAISHVTFNIKVATYDQENAFKNGKRIISAVPQSYRVVNAPYTSWLHERKTLNGDYQPNPEANAGDVVKVSAITYDDASLPHKANYRASTAYRGNQFITGSEADGYQFDFWMLENKRWAVSNLGGTGDDAYYKREKEQKDKLKDSNDEDKVKNTGIYTALCGESGDETMNNCATFVEIRCKVNYTEAGIGALQGEENGQYNDVIVRTADVVYTVHLGGVKNDWNDFAHRRNHKYTYNVTVVDVDRVIVEANGEEGRPDIEGVVNDVTEPAFELDAHYGVFNIKLSNKERTGGEGTEYENGFPFRIEVYDRNNNPIIIDETNYEQYEKEGRDYFYTWVEFRPTTDSLTLAEYKPYHKKDKDGKYIDEPGFQYDNKTFRLTDIANIEEYPGNNGSTNIDQNTQQWYTVFINEYTYETSTDETKNMWVYYVNKYPRVCWLNTSNKISKDKESVYIKSKYTVIQKSIQSFYDIQAVDVNDINIDAIGLEHWNEVYGLTLRWRDVSWMNVDELSFTNGKLNQRDYLREGNTSTESAHGWSYYFDQTHLQKITGINTSSFQADVSGLVENQVYYVPNIVTFTYRNTNTGYNRFNPNTDKAIWVQNACTNRNRDNNGDGKIDRSEIRWYLPSSGEMVDLVNGRNSLETPLMDYVSNPKLQTPPQTVVQDKSHHVNTRFHYATSNYRLLWSEEGVTINHTTNDETQWNRMGWQVRCARALGTNLTDRDPDLTPAFTADFSYPDPRIDPTYFEAKTLREPIYSVLPPHHETSTYNRISTTGFEFKRQLIPSSGPIYEADIDDNRKPTPSAHLENRATHDSYLNQGNSLCTQTFGIGWRMPNIKEAAVIKLALNNEKNAVNNNEGYNYVGNPGDDGMYTYSDGTQIAHYFACTYREYGIVTEERATKPDGTPLDPTGYYLGILYEQNTYTSAQGTPANPYGTMGRAQCLTQTGPQYRVRCVKDL